MEQFRQMGEVLGSLKAQMVLRDDSQVNQRQCILLFDFFNLAFNTIADEIRHNLRLEEKATKWKALEQPLRELVRIFKDGDSYLKRCSDTRKSWWLRAVTLHNSSDCVEFHIHNLLLYFPMAIEAVEIAAEISGIDHDEMKKKKILHANKYHQMWNDPKLFQWKYGKKYLVNEEMEKTITKALREDSWLLLEAIRKKKDADSWLAEMMTKRLKGRLDCLYPSAMLMTAKDYQVRRRIGKRNQYKEINWLGEAFVLRRFICEDQSINKEIYQVLSLSHPNVVRYLCGFLDEEKKEYFLVAESMAKDLNTHIKEMCGTKKRLPFSLNVAVDIMLQIARGMEYLHSHKIYHGDLKALKVLSRTRASSSEGYIHVKIYGYDLRSVRPVNQDEALDVVWYAPEVLAEEEESDRDNKLKYTEKSDVYSFGMLCFQILTGKTPFEDTHLKGDKVGRNIRAGGRPLFPFPLPKYLATLVKRCWHDEPSHRPSFSSICRILRYTTKVLVTNPDSAQPQISTQQVDVCDIEAQFQIQVPQRGGVAPASEIPFQLFSYSIVEKEKMNGIDTKQGSESTYSDEENMKEPSTKTNDSVVRTSSDKKMGSAIKRSRSSEHLKQLQEMKSMCPPSRPSLPKKTSSAESLNSRNERRLSLTLRRSASLWNSKDPGKSKATAGKPMQKPPLSCAEQGGIRTTTRGPPSNRKPARHPADFKTR